MWTGENMKTLSTCAGYWCLWHHMWWKVQACDRTLFCWIQDWQSGGGVSVSVCVSVCVCVWWWWGGVLLNCMTKWGEEKVESRMNTLEHGRLCPSVCFCMCIHGRVRLYRTPSAFCRRERVFRSAGARGPVLPWEWKEALGASVEGGCFERRMGGGGGRAKLLYREMDRTDWRCAAVIGRRVDAALAQLRRWDVGCCWLTEPGKTTAPDCPQRDGERKRGAGELTDLNQKL